VKLEIGSSNPVYASVHISSKKPYLPKIGAFGGGRLADNFLLFFYFFLIFSCFENDLQGGS